MKRLAALALMMLPALFACSDPILVPNTVAPTNADVFDALWNEFDLHYSFFQVKGVNWDSMRVVYRPQAIAAANDPALARVIGTMLGGLRDRHVSLTTGGTASAMTFLSKVDTAVARNPFDSHVVDRQYLQSKRVTQGGHVEFGFVSPAIGYIRIPSFEGDGWAGEIDE